LVSGTEIVLFRLSSHAEVAILTRQTTISSPTSTFEGTESSMVEGLVCFAASGNTETLAKRIFIHSKETK